MHWHLHVAVDEIVTAFTEMPKVIILTETQLAVGKV